jgi:anti-sigma factor RsiW
MSRSCAEWRADIGAYIVGALDAHEQARVRRHLAVCPGCRAEYDELVPVRAWLSRLNLPGMRPESGWLAPAPPLAGPIPVTRCNGAQVPPARHPPGRRLPGGLRQLRPRTRRRLASAAVVALTAVAFIALLVISGPAAPSFQAADSATGVSGRAQLHATPAGTEIYLTASGLPAGERCTLVAVARDGADIAGTWDATYDGSARISGTSAFPPSQLTALRIQTNRGRLLLSIPV